MLFKKPYSKIEPAAGAVVMANGIFLIGAIETFPFLNIHVGKYFAFLLLIIWIIIYTLLTVQFFQRSFFFSFIQHPIKSFAMGTWIAGVSVLCNVFLKYFPGMILITQAMAILNTFLWLFFLVTCLYNFKQLIWKQQDYPVHGILMISTVGTQSIIVLLNNVFLELPNLFSELMILLGITFYVVSMFLIMRRYIKVKGLTLVDDWENTNCIIHGALSITGLAVVSSNTFSTSFVIYLWFIILLLIVVVETIEVIRAVLRVKSYGWNEGVLQYHVSQWSRNFTFGMFYTFTLFLHQNSTYLMSDQLYHFQQMFLSVWGWVVLLALLGQIIVYIKSCTDKLNVDQEKPSYG